MSTPNGAGPFDQIEEIARIGSVLRDFGIMDAAPGLEEGWATPESCMKSCNDSLYLMGFQGRKWREQKWFPEQLDRLERRGGKVHFLLRAQDDESRTAFSDLVRRWPSCFEVRETKRRALFRLVIMDRVRMLLGHYGHEVILENGENAQGWRSPHLLISGEGEWGLMIPFLLMFEEMWDEAVPIPIEAGEQAPPLRSRKFE